MDPDPAMNAPPSRAPAAHPMDLVQGIIDLDAMDPAHPQWPRHADWADRLPSAIWAWAKQSPDEARRCGEALAAIPRYTDLLDLAGLCLLAWAFHQQGGVAIPFRTRTERALFRDATGDAHVVSNAKSWRDEGAPMPWSDPEHAWKAFRRFELIATHVPDSHDPEQPVQDASAALAAYDAIAAADTNCFARPHLSPEDWRELGARFEAERLRSALASPGAGASPPYKPAPSL